MTRSSAGWASQNYQELFTGFLQGRFRQELVNTLFFTLFFILGCLGLGLGLALILDRNPRGEGLWRTVFLFPMSLSFIVTGTIWRWMLQPQGGVNQLPPWSARKPSTFGWLSSNDAVLKFDWNALPLITAAVVGVVLIVLAVRATREGQRTRMHGGRRLRRVAAAVGRFCRSPCQLLARARAARLQPRSDRASSLQQCGR